MMLATTAFTNEPPPAEAKPRWHVDFLDEFDTFNPDNWQDQLLWVNDEDQCYVPDNAYNTREVSGGSIKLKVVNVSDKLPCENLDKAGNKHPDTLYIAGRIASKNRQEFIQGKWTARLKTWGNGQPGMFPAWWLLGARNNEPPVQQADENVCWPMTGSGEIDIFEHHGNGGENHYVSRMIKNLGHCGGGDWESLMKIVDADLDVYHEYSVEWQDDDIVYRLDGVEVYRNKDQGADFPEPLFAILNYGKINDAPMLGEWVMEVDWVKHEYWR
jgi:beta-glucanase (GH16 family)